MRIRSCQLPQEDRRVARRYLIIAQRRAYSRGTVSSGQASHLPREFRRCEDIGEQSQFFDL